MHKLADALSNDWHYSERRDEYDVFVYNDHDKQFTLKKSTVPNHLTVGAQVYFTIVCSDEKNADEIFEQAEADFAGSDCVIDGENDMVTVSCVEEADISLDEAWWPSDPAYKSIIMDLVDRVNDLWEDTMAENLGYIESLAEMDERSEHFPNRYGG